MKSMRKGAQHIRADLKAFNNAGNDLMFEACVFTFSVLPNNDDINVIMARGQARDIETINKRRIEIEFLTKLNIERTNATTHGRNESTFETDFVFANGIDDLAWDGFHVAVDVELLKEDRGVHGLHDLLHRAGDKWPDSVARDESDRAWSAVAWAVHVGDGSRGDPVGREEVL